MKYLLMLILGLGLSQASGQENQYSSYTFRVEGDCGMCQDRIEATAQRAGAASASWDMTKKILSLEVDEGKYSVNNIRYELAQSGHDNGAFLAPDAVYNNLPDCCQYRDVREDNTWEDRSLVNTEGYIYGMSEENKKIPLIGANVQLIDTEKGTITDDEGYFTLSNPDKNTFIVVSYIGYNTDTVEISRDGMVEIILSDGFRLEEVQIVYRQRTTEVSFLKPILVEEITQGELRKAACCNLSESFETNPSIDVSFTDAVTGTRQIQMLGLSGQYVQITRELIPDVRGLASIYGLTFTPGPWIESIHLNKGTGSVMNGFESMTGQINVELKKPERGEKLHINGFINEGQRMELNANARTIISDKVSTSILVHGKKMGHAPDRNGDGFLDMPLEENLVVANRWKFDSGKGLVGQIGAKGTNIGQQGGVFEHFDGSSEDHSSHWQMYNDTKRLDVWAKTGYLFPEKPYASIGFQISGNYHDQDAEFGFKPYNSTQRSLYANLIYQSIFSDTKHTFKTGLSYQLDDIEERTGFGFFERRESVPGAFFEYTYNNLENFAIVPGIRVDHHNNYGTFFTPRLHLKYNLSDDSVIRLSAGRGLRTANIFADNIGLFATSRHVRIAMENSDNPYGLAPEIAWNVGLNFTQCAKINDRLLTVTFDAYRTMFENQVVVDYDIHPQEVHFYNLDGDSYSNSFQVKLEYEVLPRLDVRVAYRLFDVKATYAGELQSRPLIAKHRSFANFAYSTETGWSFDLTTNWQGRKRLPDTSTNPVQYQKEPYSTDFVTVNTQISKSWNEVFEVYIGAENLFNFKQNSAIIAQDDTFGPYFDASIVWAPLFGRNIYMGFRYTIGE